ncbi:hypothetical protein TRIATDRAFT_300007 [Trichoderma atroviride IMI 206040]|uniref:Uncharacterized protein n=1 Tax=Hypocrea atroviridis (strain ATCC 20476 / IMI 206040) TaxID=452589 RepID=G9NWJ7_HYPAI|nr:uncharacterized protein TRIATDRAFT_300007 [Trichoderma atroviride IMI 206040]EHK45352.1 hypothetical protein TRIATDRAFT_300007 [Trichoderma atroviride IMI 206040]
MPRSQQRSSPAVSGHRLFSLFSPRILPQTCCSMMSSATLCATGKSECPSQDSRAFDRRSASPIKASSAAVGCIGFGPVEKWVGGAA